MAKASGSIDLKATLEASKVASNFLAVGSSGLMVYDGQNGSQNIDEVDVNNILITSGDVQIREGTSILASYGATSEIGSDGGYRSVLSNEGYKLISEDDNEIFSVSPSGNPTSELYIYTENERHNFRTNNVTLTKTPVTGTKISVKTKAWSLNPVRTDGVWNYAKETATTFTAGTNQTITVNNDTATTTLYGNISFKITYTASTQTFSASTFGSNLGSLAFFEVKYYVNGQAVDLGIFTFGTRRDGSVSGNGSATFGRELVACGNGQLVIGRYNIADTNNTYAIIVGTGTQSTPADSFRVGWNGDVQANHLERLGGKGIYVSSNASGTLYYGLGNNEEITRINTKTTSIDSTGTSFIIANGYYAIGSTGEPSYNNENVYISGGRDSTSRWVAIPNAYNRTYSSTSGLYQLYVTSNGMLGRYVSSSIRYKHDVEYLTNENNSVIDNSKKIRRRKTDDSDIMSVLDIPIVKFKYNDGYVTGESDYDYSKYELGFIAEDVANICPECATYEIDENGNKIPEAYDTRQILIRMLYIMQKQEKRIVELEQRISKLKCE